MKFRNEFWLILFREYISLKLFAVQISTIILSIEAEGLRELDQHVIPPSLVKGEWPRRCDLYWDGRSVPPVLEGAA
jgi:hypothetical protein